MGFLHGASGKEPGCQCRRRKRCRFNPWVGKFPWRKAWQPTPVFLPGEFHGQRSPAGYSPWGRKESDTTEVAYDNTYLYMYSKTLNHSIAEIVTSHWGDDSMTRWNKTFQFMLLQGEMRFTANNMILSQLWWWAAAATVPWQMSGKRQNFELTPPSAPCSSILAVS